MFIFTSTFFESHIKMKAIHSHHAVATQDQASKVIATRSATDPIKVTSDNNNNNKNIINNIFVIRISVYKQLHAWLLILQPLLTLHDVLLTCLASVRPNKNIQKKNPVSRE